MAPDGSVFQCLKKHRLAGPRLLGGYVDVVNGNGRALKLAIRTIEPTSLDPNFRVLGGVIRDHLLDVPFHSRLLWQ